MGDNPSGTRAGLSAFGARVPGLHPVDHANWLECLEFAQRLDLEMPTERQWEYACRAGEGGPWYWGSDQAELEYHENVRDQYFQAAASWLATDATWDDGFGFHAPVGETKRRSRPPARRTRSPPLRGGA